jgi:hypothetical protein
MPSQLIGIRHVEMADGDVGPMARRAAASRSGDREAIATDAPAACERCAIASPMPLEPPITSTLAPQSSRAVFT